MKFISFDKPKEALIAVTSARADEDYVVFNVKDYEFSYTYGREEDALESILVGKEEKNHRCQENWRKNDERHQGTNEGNKAFNNSNVKLLLRCQHILLNYIISL